jgi:GntR family transcriptional regulator/MocR family aminotransferase
MFFYLIPIEWLVSTLKSILYSLGIEMLRPWDFEFVLLENSHTSIHQQLTHSIIAYINSGFLAPQSALPGTRALAEKLSINRKTVIRAYDELIESGWLYTEHKRGTFVSSFLPSQNNFPVSYRLTVKPQNQPLTTIADAKSLDSQWTYLDRFQTDTSIIDFAVFSRATRHAMISRSRKLTHYQVQDGAAIRSAVVNMLKVEYKLQVNVENLHVLPNASSSIYFITKTLVNVDEFIVMEAYHDASTRKIFDNITNNIITVKHDENGININDLEKLCINYKIKLLYLTPNAQAITGICLPLENRKQLALIADKYQFYIIEDDSQCGVLIENLPVPIATFDHRSHVIYLGCILEGISSVLNLAFLVASTMVIEKIGQQACVLKDTNTEVVELAVANLINSGEIKKQRMKARIIISDRKNNFIQLISTHLKDYMHLQENQFGRSLTVQFTNNIDIENFKKAATDAKISLDINTIFQHSEFQHYLNLNFYHLNNNQQAQIVTIFKNIFLNELNALQYLP